MGGHEAPRATENGGIWLGLIQSLSVRATAVREQLWIASMVSILKNPSLNIPVSTFMITATRHAGKCHVSNGTYAYDYYLHIVLVPGLNPGRKIPFELRQAGSFWVEMIRYLTLGIITGPMTMAHDCGADARSVERL